MLGPRIKQAREDADLTLRELAEEIGVDPRTVAGYQSGRSRPSYERLVAIAKATKKPPAYFIEEAA